jgi:hypothetical protein
MAIRISSIADGPLEDVPAVEQGAYFSNQAENTQNTAKVCHSLPLVAHILSLAAHLLLRRATRNRESWLFA